jgi:hypothetical protein
VSGEKRLAASETAGAGGHGNVQTGSKNNSGLLGGGAAQLIPEQGEKVHLKAALGVASGAGVRILQDRQFGYLLGGPKVIIEPRKDHVLVRLSPRPWGWPSFDREVWSGPEAAERYAFKVLAYIMTKGRAEHERRERLLEARQRERAGR